MSVADTLGQIKKYRTNVPVNVVRTQGMYDDYIMLMAKKYHEQDNTNSYKIMIIMDRYDGAEHRNTKDKRTSIISFSSQMFGKDTIVSGVSTANSLNILTWQQMQGDEKAKYVFPAIKPIFQTKKDIIDNSMALIPNSKLFLYDIHDGKMLYLITQYSLLIVNSIPFLCALASEVKV